MNLVQRTKLLMLDAGAEWVMWLLFGLSILSLAIILERVIVLMRASGDINALRERLSGELRHGQFDAAKKAMDRSRHPAARVALKGLERVRAAQAPAQVEQAMRAELIAQKTHLEQRLSFLGTLGSNAPFVGLFGTVIGIVAAFEHLGKGSALASTSSTELVMAAIAEALVSTAVGIGVAIPAIFGFNHLLRLAKQRLQGAELLTRELLAALPVAAESEGK